MELPPSRRELLADRFADYPLIRMLILNRGFRWVVLSLMGAAVCTPLFLARIWVTSPDGFVPVVKVSLLDLLQARSLAQTARRLAAQGLHREAATAWQNAIANDRGDPALIRGALEHVLTTTELSERAASRAIARTAWLLRLSAWAAADVELAARVYARYQMHRDVVVLLAPRRDDLNPNQAAVYLKALFHLGRTEEFLAGWQALGARVPDDPELPLYWAAYLAGWGPAATVGENRRQVDAAAMDPARAILAARLRLVLAQRALDAGAYAAALRQLEENEAARLVDQTRYWKLLREVGRKQEAQRLATNYVEPPATSGELLQLTEAYVAVGMTEAALRLLERFAPQMAVARTPWAPEIWLSYATLLIDAARWEELERVAVALRAAPETRLEFAGFSYFLEGRALLGLGREDDARSAFARMIETGIAEPLTALRAGTALARLGMRPEAWALLIPLEQTMAQHLPYCEVMSELAHSLRQDPALLLRFAAGAHRLQPANPGIQLNYLSALLIARADPDEAIRLSLDFVQRNPGLVGARLNHAIALAQSGRAAEARSVLQGVDPRLLGAADAALYHLTRFEVNVSLRRFDEARDDLARIRTDLLFTNQVVWLERTRERSPAELASPAKKKP